MTECLPLFFPLPNLMDSHVILDNKLDQLQNTIIGDLLA